MRWMNEPKHPLHEKATLSYPSLFDTLFESDADKDRRLPDEPIDIVKILEENTDTDKRETSALARSKRVRSNANWLPEKAVKARKAYFTNENTGYLYKEVKSTSNPMNMMANPDMMNNMLK